MNGACLNKTIRYYRCRNTWPTSVRPKTCDAPYVRADQLEEQVWKSVAETLRQPEPIVAEIKRRQSDVSDIKAEIERVRKSLARLDDQERRLVKLYTLAEIDDSFLKKESAQLKKQHVELDAEIVVLEKQKRQTESLDKISDQVKDYCAKVATKLDSFSFEDKRLALKALQIRIVVGKSGVRLFGLIPDFNATIEQTSASRHVYSCPRPPVG